MRPEIVDYVRGELSAREETVLRARIEKDPALERELEEAQALFGIMGQGPEIEPRAALRIRFVASLEAQREREPGRSAPSLGERLAFLGGLVIFRLRNSSAFRVAALSIAVHLVALYLLLQHWVPAQAEDKHTTFIVKLPPAKAEPVGLRPSEAFVGRLAGRNRSIEVKLGKAAVPGQAKAIRSGIEELVGGQADDGSLGDVAQTGYGSLALLAEGECSAFLTEKSRNLRRALEYVAEQGAEGNVHGAAVCALVEDYALSYSWIPEARQAARAALIVDLLAELPRGPASDEARLVAKLAGFPLDSSRLSAEARALYTGLPRAWILDLEPSRLRATVAFARGGVPLDPERLNRWVRPFFLGVLKRLREGGAVAERIVTLQSPYRL
ncbi:MAG: hypothetical protein O7C98_13600 [Planctomycetota bacterium]|nr:hypothetical protein [Planctomycetota bacterium]